MNSFRTPRDEYIDIEKRWQFLSKRESEVRAREEQLRRYLDANPSMAMAISAQMPMQQTFPQARTRPPPPPYRKKNRKKNIPVNDKHKDYAQFAVKPDINYDIAKDRDQLAVEPGPDTNTINTESL